MKRVDPTTDWMSLAGRKKLGFPDSWRWIEAEAITGGTLLTGGIVTYKENGDAKFPKSADQQKVFITKDDIDKEKGLYEEQTGKCWRCEGTGDWVYGWSIDEGSKKKPCSRCEATGNAPIDPILEAVTHA